MKIFSHRHFERHVHKRLRIRLALYFLFALIFIIISIYHIYLDKVVVIFPIISFAIGIILGTAVSRMFHITWDHGARQVISRFDIFGAVILILYIYFEINRREIIEIFVHGPSVVAVSLSLFSGIMIGRILGMRGKIRQVLNENL